MIEAVPSHSNRLNHTNRARVSFTVALLVFIGFVVIRPVASQTVAAPSRDAQQWNEVQLSIPLRKAVDGKTDKVTLFVSGNFRLRQNMSRPADERIGFGIDFKVSKHWTLGAGVLFRAAQPFENRKETEGRPRFDAVFETKAGSFTFKNRNRLEFRARSGAPNSFRYRNRIQLETPLLINGKEVLKPFIANEVFYDFRGKNLMRNDSSIGVARRLGSHTQVELFYMYEINDTREFSRINILGTSLKFRLK
ncbi:MAG: DUF2490 domain-containing protein [Acidobacteriota bacterium]